MAIPESQLLVWSHQGAVSTSKATHESIRNALNAYSWPSDVRFEVFLQGSYKNDTNIRGDSDVDVVAQLNSCIRLDDSALTPAERYAFQRNSVACTYDWPQFRTDVVRALRSHFGPATVGEGKKALKLRARPGRLPADLVVCTAFRKYRRYSGAYNQDYVEGITFYVPIEGRWVVNYPKLHYENGVTKHRQTGDMYKPAVRVFKNARTHLVEQGEMSENLAPSYFLECLIYNVPSPHFVSSYQDTYCNVVNWLSRSDLRQCICQNGQMLLFGTSSEQWAIQDAHALIGKLASLWNAWR